MLPRSASGTPETKGYDPGGVQNAEPRAVLVALQRTSSGGGGGGSSSSTLSEEAPQASGRQLEQEIVYEKLPSDIAERYVLLMDPILASGNSAARAIQVRGRERAGQRRCFG